MREVLIGKLEDGMTVAENVMTKGGQCVLEKGKVLNRQTIMRLSFYSIKSIMVEDAKEKESVSTEAPSTPSTPAKLEPKSLKELLSAPIPSAPETPEQAKKVTQKIASTQKAQSLQLAHIIALSAIQSSFSDYVHLDAPLDTAMLLDKVKELFSSCKTSVELFQMIHQMHSTEDSIYAHCLNVALICRQIGKWSKFNSADLDTLTLCGVLHDIGKLKVPEDILNKPGKYTDEEFAIVKKHTQYGHELLKSLPIDDHIKKSARSHHERCDGSGYPSGLLQEDTDEFAMIVAIADVYDAMTAARSYRAPLCPFQAIACFEKDGLQKYNPKYILTFLSHIAGIYQNHRVLLSDGRSATIVMKGTKELSRPIVQLDDNSCIDLSTERSLTIQSVL